MQESYIISQFNYNIRFFTKKGESESHVAAREGRFSNLTPKVSQNLKTFSWGQPQPLVRSNQPHVKALFVRILNSQKLLRCLHPSFAYIVLFFRVYLTNNRQTTHFKVITTITWKLVRTSLSFKRRRNGCVYL